MITLLWEIDSFAGVTERQYHERMKSTTATFMSSIYKWTSDKSHYSRLGIQRPTAIFSQAETKSKSVKSFVQVLEEIGQKLMPMALEAKEQSIIHRDQCGNTSAQENRFSHRAKSIFFSLKSCALFSLFIVYRAYRGFFVLLPVVFRQSYAKLKASVDSPFVEEADEKNNSSQVLDEDINPQTGQVRLRTRVVVSILSMIVVASFVVNGALEVLLKFLTTIRKTSSIETSFEAAAEKVLINEDKVQKYTVKKGGMKINGV